MEYHDAQPITIIIPLNKSQYNQTYCTIKINKNTAVDFQIKLSYETGDSVFESDDLNKIFKSF
jgi:hypothetical protein